MGGGRDLFLALALSLAFVGVQARPLDEDNLADAVQAVGLDMAAAALVSHCETAAPQASGGLRDTWRRWRTTARMSEIETSLGPQKLESVRRRMGVVAARGVDQLKAMGPAAQTCPLVPGWLAQAPFDTRKSLPGLYASLDQRVAAEPRPADRAAAAAEPVAQAPAAGLKPGEIHGLLYDNEIIIGGGLEETVLLLLADGTYYRGRKPPDRLDVAMSRRLEPRLWGRWRRTPQGRYQIQPQNQSGAALGWRDQDGVLTGRWVPGQKLNGAYRAEAFNGSIATGGVHSSTTFRFSSDGRFERIGYARGGSGSMAAVGGFVGSASTLSDGKGTSGSAGGGDASAFASATSRLNDGASNRGVYRLSGLTLELRYDDGRTESVLCAPWGKNGSIYMFGRTFSRR